MSKTPKPIIHGRDHQRGGADVMLIAWADCEGTPEPPAVGGGWKTVPVSLTWTTHDMTSPPATIADTFAAGTVPGVWGLGTAASTMTYLASTNGNWQVDVSGTVTHTGVTCPVRVLFEHDFDSGSRVEFFNHTMADTDSLPFTHTSTLVDPFEVALPVKMDIFAGVCSSTITGTMTFTWMG